MAETLCCRLCQSPLTSGSGCDSCTPLKALLTVSGNAEDDHVDLLKLADDSARLLRTQLDKLSMAERGKAWDDKRAEQARRQTVAISKVLTEARKLHSEAAASEAGMTFPERVNLMIEWFQGLPEQHQRKVLAALRRVNRDETQTEAH